MISSPGNLRASPHSASLSALAAAHLGLSLIFVSCAMVTVLIPMSQVCDEYQMR